MVEPVELINKSFQVDVCSRCKTRFFVVISTEISYNHNTEFLIEPMDPMIKNGGTYHGCFL